MAKLLYASTPEDAEIERKIYKLALGDLGGGRVAGHRPMGPRERRLEEFLDLDQVVTHRKDEHL